MGQFIKTRRLLSLTSPLFSYSEADGFKQSEDAPGVFQFTKSGNFISKNTSFIDVFLVGAGAGGGFSKNGGGGGSGYTVTQRHVQLIAGRVYRIIIGAGGMGSTKISEAGKDGGATSAFGFSAEGGQGGGSYGSGNPRKGGDGGSGGGAGSAFTLGGKDGEHGESASKTYLGGKGQGSTTRAFGESDGELFATGGNGSDGTSHSRELRPLGSGGDGGLNGEAGFAGLDGVVLIRMAR